MKKDDLNVAILTFEGFNEIDSFIALNMINRCNHLGLFAKITCLTPNVTSMNGVCIQAQASIDFMKSADAVLVGSGTMTQKWVQDDSVMSRLSIDPQRQIVGAQCSGTLMLAKLGLLDSGEACTDSFTKSYLEKYGVKVLARPFYAQGNVGTAGGCLSAALLATWMIWRLIGEDAALEALSYVLPVGEEQRLTTYVQSYINLSINLYETEPS